jgi:hypothetical protein
MFDPLRDQDCKAALAAHHAGDVSLEKLHEYFAAKGVSEDGTTAAIAASRPAQRAATPAAAPARKKAKKAKKPAHVADKKL